MWKRGRGRGRGNNRNVSWNPSGNRGRRGNFGNRGFRGGNQNFRERDFRSNDKQFKTDYPKRSFDKKVEKLNEKDVGITEFISTLEGFSGILKSRYSDFHVNEIDLNGKIAKLTDLTVPKDPEPEPQEEDDELLVNRYRIEQLPIETWDKIHKMVQTRNMDEIVEIDVTPMTKEDRTKIHEAIKTVFGQKIVGSTITKDDKKFVTIKLFNKNERIDRREKWPKSRGGEYVYFLVYKEYTDTIEANIQISESLNMRPSNFCYAGVKDRRAKTTQWFCTRKVDPKRIVECTKHMRNIHVGNFCYKTETLKLGQLKGNRFRIALRNVTADNDVLDNALGFLRDNGFINYYGLQRFGNCKEVPTHEIGIQLLKGNWKEAVQLILKPRKYDQEKDVATARQIYESTGNAKKAYATLEKKRNRCIEGRLLGGLMHAENDYVNSLEKVPRNMRLLYIHAFQSYIWNKIVSRRIKEFGMSPIVGDIVIDGDLIENLECIEGTDEGDFWRCLIKPGKNDKIFDHAMSRFGGPENQGETENETVINEKDNNKKQVKIKFLAESDLPNYTIYDIVLPLPGYDISYPTNVVKDWYDELLGEYGLTLEMPKQRVKTYTLSGTYRKILERVSNFSWKIMRYNIHTANLIRSDYEELLGKPEPEDILDGQFKALIIDFCLSSSCYATMALREVMKMDTSVETHMNLDNSVQQNNQSTQTTTSIPFDVQIDNIPKENIKNDLVMETNENETTDEYNPCLNKEPSVDKRKLPDSNYVDYKKIKTERASFD